MGPGVLFLFFGIFYSFQKPKIEKLQAENFPDIPSVEFKEWKRLQLLSIGILQWATFGQLPFACFLSLPNSELGVTEEGQTTANLILILLVVVGLVTSAVYGSAATKIKRKYNFNEKQPHIPADINRRNQTKQVQSTSAKQSVTTSISTSTASGCTRCIKCNSLLSPVMKSCPKCGEARTAVLPIDPTETNVGETKQSNPIENNFQHEQASDKACPVCDKALNTSWNCSNCGYTS
jgi:hypothetical protein